MKSKKVNLKNCQAVLYLKIGKDSYLHADLRGNAHGLKDGIIYSRVTFSPDYLDRAYFIINDNTPGSSYSYKMKIKDWIKKVAKKVAQPKK